MSDLTTLPQQQILTSPVAQGLLPAQSQFMAVALRCLEKGWYVFPLGEKSKTPDGALAPNGFNSSSKEPNQIREWWMKSPNANIGIDLGRSNLTVLDFDNGGPPVELGLPPTLQIHTSRGTHVYLAGTSKQGDMHFAGNHVGEIKSAGGYALSPFSVHPTGAVYSVAVQAAIAPIPEGLIDRLRPERKSSPTINGEKIPRGSHDTELTRIAGKLRHDGLEENALADALIEVCEKRCENYGSDYRKMCEKIAKSVCRYPVGRDGTLNLSQIPGSTSSTPVINEPDAQPRLEIVDELSPDTIPAFQPYWVTGIYKKFVDVITKGTTMTPQFAYLAAKVVVGLKMAGKVHFDNLDAEPRYFGALIGETGSGKGESWRRMMQILLPTGGLGDTTKTCGIKVINSADSGAGLKECFFDPPENQPVICYVDEVEGLGNKATATRNPAILDTMIELADSTTISRMLAKKRKTKDDARLAIVMCGQDGDTYMKAFAGRTKLGMYDRLYPEYAVPVEAGELPPIQFAEAHNLLKELNELDYSGVMTTSQDAKDSFNTFWDSQPKEVRTKARWKKNAILDAYMAAFGRGSKIVELDDIDVAIQLCIRQLIIRKVCFRSEVPDKVGFYLGKIKDMTNRMKKQLKAGMAASEVALSRRDYESLTNAYRDNEEHFFEKAWMTHCRVHLREVDIQKANGQKYKKFLPQAFD